MRLIPAKNHGPATNRPIIRIVEHGTVTPCGRGWAERVGHMFANTSRDASTQQVTDTGETIRCVPDSVVAYGAPPNTGSLHRELTDPQTGPGSRWQDADHQAMLRQAAIEDAKWATQYRIPVRHLSVADVRRGAKGFCGHKDISDAFHQTDHVDPGPDFPWTQYLALVKAAQKNPQPAPGGDDDMPTPVTASVHDRQEITALAPAWKVLGIRPVAGGKLSPSIVAGPARVEGTVTIYLDHIPSGPVVVNAYQAGLVNGEMELVDTAGTAKYSGTDQLQFHISRTIPKGRLLRLRIQASEPLAVTYVRHDVSTWKA